MTQDAFRRLFDEHVQYVWNTLRRMGVREADLGDITQEVFLTAFRKLADYDASRPMRPWLFGISFRVASGHRKLARHRREVMQDQEVEDPSRSAHQRLETEQERALVVDALASMQEDARAVLIAHDIDGMEMAEVTDALGIPLFTGYSRLRRARQDFEAIVKRMRAKERP